MLEPSTLAGYGALVIDRFTVWLSNRLAASDQRSDGDLLKEIEVLSDRLYRSATGAVLVTTEVGIALKSASFSTLHGRII